MTTDPAPADEASVDVGPAEVESIDGGSAPLTVVSDAAGRLRLRAPWLTGSVARAVAVEDAVAALTGIRAVHAFHRTGAIVVWYRADRYDRDHLWRTIRGAGRVAADAACDRVPRSQDVSGADVARMVVGGLALALLGVRRYGFRRPAVLGPSGRLLATGVTVFTGYPFIRGAVRSLLGRRGPGTDALVSAATIASLVLRENVVALTVLWLLNIGEHVQDLTMRRTRRAITELLSGNVDSAWVRVTTSAGVVEQQVDLGDLEVGDEVVVYEQVAIPIDGEVIEGSAVVDQSAITGESLPVSIDVGDPVHAGSVVKRGRPEPPAGRV
ncbi:MAG: hypothetical protein QM650_13905 [Microlunatus sp.]